FTYTATTIGFGELPHNFSIAQRWWIIASIYLSVVGWAYTVARMISLLQDSAFNAAYAAQSVKRTISHIREPFTIIVGYGYIGRTVARSLDALGRRIVVLDSQSAPIERLATDMLQQEPPGICADARNPAVLGLAGLDHPDCEAILALTGDEQANLQILMTCSLLRPELSVIARASSRRVAMEMSDFSPTTVINPYEDFGARLVLALKRPQTYRLITWLTAADGTPLPAVPPTTGLRSDRWLVVGDDDFGPEISRHLTLAGYEVVVATPDDDHDFTEVGAVIAGSSSDMENLALAAHLRHTHPDIFIVVRQQSHAQLPLLQAFCPDSIFFPPQLVSQRAVINLITPYLWEFVESTMKASEQFSADLTTRLVERCGDGSPVPARLTIDEHNAPTVVRWLRHRPLKLGALLRSPQDWTTTIAAFPLLLIRDGKAITLPDDDIDVALNDVLVMVGTSLAFNEQCECLYDDSTLFYTATGHDIPTSRLWRRLTGQRWKDAFPSD
ncbi:MAG: NAD-binding protein, partial [Propionibacteriaceae bacterium]|nr:NAD-binding protein [Propionibacteriaceae bacterium]